MRLLTFALVVASILFPLSAGAQLQCGVLDRRLCTDECGAAGADHCESCGSIGPFMTCEKCACNTPASAPPTAPNVNVCCMRGSATCGTAISEYYWGSRSSCQTAGGIECNSTYCPNGAGQLIAATAAPRGHYIEFQFYTGSDDQKVLIRIKNPANVNEYRSGICPAHATPGDCAKTLANLAQSIGMSYILVGDDTVRVFFDPNGPTIDWDVTPGIVNCPGGLAHLPNGVTKCNLAEGDM